MTLPAEKSPADATWYAERARVREIAVRLCQRGSLDADADPVAEALVAIEALRGIAEEAEHGR